jgi:hypothetical protein
MKAAARVGTLAVGPVSTVLSSCVFQQRQQKYHPISCTGRLSRCKLSSTSLFRVLVLRYRAQPRSCLAAAAQCETSRRPGNLVKRDGPLLDLASREMRNLEVGQCA